MKKNIIVTLFTFSSVTSLFCMDKQVRLIQRPTKEQIRYKNTSSTNARQTIRSGVTTRDLFIRNAIRNHYLASLAKGHKFNGYALNMDAELKKHLPESLFVNKAFGKDFFRNIAFNETLFINKNIWEYVKIKAFNKVEK